MTGDLSTAYTSWPNTEPVTVTIRRAAGAEETIAVTRALRRAVTISSRSFGPARIGGHELVWNLPAAELNGAELHPGDTITDAQNTVWQVSAVQLLSRGSRWRCLCLKRSGE